MSKPIRASCKFNGVDFNPRLGTFYKFDGFLELWKEQGWDKKLKDKPEKVYVKCGGVKPK
jgi:hypothetical protein